MTTSGAANGRERYYIKICPVGKDQCHDFIWDPKNYGDTKDEVIDKFKDHLRCVHSFDSRKVPGVVESLCEILETETFLETAAEDTPTPPMPASALTPKQPAMPPPSVENEPAENASSSSKRRKVETPDKAPALKSEDDDTVEIRNDVVLAINAADEPADEPPAPEPDEDTIEIGPDVMAALMHAMRLFAVTMDDAVATLGEAATTMSNFLKGQFK